MARWKVLMLLLLTVVAYVAVKCTSAASLGNPTNYAAAHNISARCLANSVTPVSCANMRDAEDYLWPHPDDCGLFYFCLSPILPPVCRDCPNGLHWNSFLRVCDWPQTAGCKANNG